MPNAGGVKTSPVAEFGHVLRIVGKNPCQEDNVHGFLSGCALGTDRFRGHSCIGDNCFRDKREHRNLHAHFDLLHSPTRVFQFCC